MVSTSQQSMWSMGLFNHGQLNSGQVYGISVQLQSTKKVVKVIWAAKSISKMRGKS
jgi:hypothetical protein